MKSFLSLLAILLLGLTACADGSVSPAPPVDYVDEAQSEVDAEEAGADERPAVAISEPPIGGLPNRMVIPRLEMDTPVVNLGWNTGTNGDGYVFSQWEVAENAAGWHENSAQLGEGGNVVMSGHNNILGAVFRELDQLRENDEITVYTDDVAFEYTVERVLIVPEKRATVEQRAENAQWITQMGDDRLTLVSCWPRDNNTHRIIVVARPETSAVSSQ